MSTRWYPIYQKGNPQLRVFLPNFWMKIVSPESIYGTNKVNVPKNKVHFVVSSQMTRIDVKNYLEKIYKVPVSDVRTLNKMGKTRRNAFAEYIVKDDDYKVAFVTLAPGTLQQYSIKSNFAFTSGHTFEMPDLKIKGLQEEYTETQQEDINNAKKQFAEEIKSDDIKYRPGVPTFFGL